MSTPLVRALNLRFDPVAILWTDEKPDEALQFKAGRWGCVMSSFATVAAKGKAAVFDRETYGCWGGGVGLGFGNCYEDFPGGVEGFCGFLSDGNGRTERGRGVAQACASWMRGSLREDFLEGEGYRRSPETVQRWLDTMPMRDVPSRYVVFRPLDQLEADQVPVAVVLLADPDQMSALVVLANYRRGDSEGAIIPHAAGCQSLGIFTYHAAEADPPRAVIGLNDPSARQRTRRLGKDLVTVSLPWSLYRQMEEDVQGSFLEKGTWASLEVGSTERS